MVITDITRPYAVFDTIFHKESGLLETSAKISWSGPQGMPPIIQAEGPTARAGEGSQEIVHSQRPNSMGTIINVIPHNTPKTGGNATSAERVGTGLKHFGWNVSTIHYGLPLPKAEGILAWNAWTVAAPLIAQGIDLAHMVVVWTGTDLWDGLAQEPDLPARLDRVLCHVVFTESARARLLEYAPHWHDRIVVIAPGVDEYLFHPHRVDTPSIPTILVAGGIREVKRTHWAVDLVESMREAGTLAELWLVGPARDSSEAARVQDRAKTRPWVKVWGEIPRVQMPSMYCRATVLLNTSRAEGVSNALMEAMACGIPVVAANIDGNASLIDHGQTGWLFNSAEDFVRRMPRILDDAQSRHRIADAAREAIRQKHGAHREAAAYRSLFEKGVSARH